MVNMINICIYIYIYIVYGKCDKYMYIYIYIHIVITSKIRTPPYVFSNDPGESWLICLLGMLDRHTIRALRSP